MYVPGNQEKDQGRINTAIRQLAEGHSNAAWTAYTPAITVTTGALTTYTASGRYLRWGSSVKVNIAISISTNGTGATALFADLPPNLPMSPIPTWGAVLVGRERFNTGKMLQGLCSGTSVQIAFYDGSYPGADGARIVLNGEYETG